MMLKSIFLKCRCGTLLLLLGLLQAPPAQAQLVPPHTHDQATAPADTHQRITLLNHQRVMRELFGEPRMAIKTVGILLYEGCFTLDAVGPMSVMSELMGTDVFYIGLKKGHVQCGRTKIWVDKTLADVKKLDVLIIPGGSVATFELSQDTAVLNWIRQIDRTTQITASVCSGAWILGATGLLEGRQVSTHWYRAQEVMSRFGATYTNQRYTVDGKYWTSAGVTAGMDMCLAMIIAIRGEKYVQAAMLDLEYAPQPPVQAGTPETSDPAVVHMMMSMYDYGMLPLLNKKSKKRK